MTTTTNKMVSANADFFIVPNSARKIDNCFFPEIELERAKTLCHANNKEFDKDHDKLVQVWIVAPELHTENLTDHGMYVNIDGKKYYSHGFIRGYIPRSLIDIKENEATDVIFNDIKCRCKEINHEETIDLKLHMTAKQREYRYARFGSYEHTMELVCS